LYPADTPSAVPVESGYNVLRKSTLDATPDSASVVPYTYTVV
jgi:hypothetical protein